MSHSLFGASSIARREFCPGSYHAELGLPEVKSDVAQRGTDLHEVVKLVTGGDLATIEAYKQLEDYERSQVVFCLDIANQELAAFNGRAVIDLEKPLDASWINPTPPPIWTIPDIVAYEPFGTGWIADYKFGHKPVARASENRQLRMLACALANKYGLSAVKVSLIQPASRHVSHYVYLAEELISYALNLREIIDAAREPNAPRNAGDHCAYCKAAGNCYAIAEKSSQLPAVLSAGEITVHQMSDWLDKAAMVETFLKGIRQRAHAILESGGSIPGYKLEAGRDGNRQWSGASDPVPDLQAIASAIGKPLKDIYEAPNLVSPAQLEKKWGNGKEVKEAIKKLVTRSPGKVHLKKEEKE